MAPRREDLRYCRCGCRLVLLIIAVVDVLLLSVFSLLSLLLLHDQARIKKRLNQRQSHNAAVHSDVAWCCVAWPSRHSAPRHGSFASPPHSLTMASRAVLRVMLLSANATAPSRGSSHAAGYDLYRYYPRGSFGRVVLECGCQRSTAVRTTTRSSLVERSSSRQISPSRFLMDATDESVRVAVFGSIGRARRAPASSWNLGWSSASVVAGLEAPH